MSNNSRQNTMGIARKLILIILPLMALAIIIMMSVNYATTKKTLIANAEQILQKETTANVNTIETFAESTLSSLNRVYDVMKTVPFASEEDKIAYLTTTCEMQPEIPQGVYMGNNNNYWLDSAWTPPEDYQVAEQRWYREGLTHSSFAFGLPYVDASTSEYIVSATALLSSEDGVDTVIAADVELAALSKSISSIRVMNSGYCFLVDTATSAILAHRDKNLIGTVISKDSENLILSTAASMADVTDYSMKRISNSGSNYMIAVEPVENTDWILVSCIDEKSVLSGLSRLQFFYIGLSLLVILLTAVIISQIIRIMIAPVKTLTDTINTITDGDFSVDIKVKGNDEISVMSAALKDFVEIMREVIGDISTVCDELNEQAAVSKEVASTLSETAATQSETMGDMAMTIEQLTSLLPDDQTEIGEELLASMQTFSDASLELSQESADVSGCADILSESAFTLAEHMRKFKI